MYGIWLTMWASVLMLIVIFTPSQGIRKGKSCELPAEWKGRWFEYGEREAISVSKWNVTHKGLCKFMDGDRYIFYEKKNQCYRCAMMYQKHENVLQYRESLCEPNFDFRRRFNLCYTIPVDSQIKSMFRLEGEAIDCPLTIKDNPVNRGDRNSNTAFQLTYSRGHGTCDWPISSMSQCSDKSKMKFRYQACADIKGSESIVEEVSCVAKWKEGSTFYFLGLLNNSHVQPDDYERRFRCFAYSKIFEGYHVAQSGDAECNLPNAMEGDRTMVLKQVKSNQNRCNLPSWMLRHHRYHNLNETTHYHFNKKGTSLTISQSNADSAEEESKTLKCNTILEDTGNYSQMIMQVNFECESGFMCLEVNYRSENVISTRIGRLSRNRDEACDTQLFFDKSMQSTTLISAKHVHERCPLVGKYSISSLEFNPQHDPSLSTRNRKWTHEPTPIKSRSLKNNECASTFLLADDDETRMPSSHTKQSFSSSDTKSYLMFGCAGESKFRLLNSCKNQRLLTKVENVVDYTFDKDNHRGSSSMPSPLKTTKERKGFGNLPLAGSQNAQGDDDAIIEGYSCHGGWREPLTEPGSENIRTTSTINRRQPTNYGHNSEQNSNYHFQNGMKLSQHLYSSNQHHQQQQPQNSQASRSSYSEIRNDDVRSRSSDDRKGRNLKNNMNRNNLDSDLSQQHLSSYVQYLIVSPLTKSDTSPHLHKRLCARIIVQNPVELSFVSLIADEDECPTRNDVTNDIRGVTRTKPSYNMESNNWNNENIFRKGKTKWRFNLTRTSECAQALATANSGSRIGIFLLQINFSKASILLLGVVLYKLLVQQNTAFNT